ncbi:hypothetical protein CFC21_024483 [Triticum aestivum]|uniref:Uncharacterized protein n=3 Tax=Triticum TaxID=4564 RepID=A0A9R1PUH4_TRITD|nr:hypothetical protein CFC21_024483 [Triticum aestivum]VAH49588.1 unnamed protein product [Triticum turgidum subsp. durum]
MSSQSANMTLGSTGVCGRIEATTPGTVRLLESSAIGDDSSGPDEPEMDGWLTVLRSRVLSLGGVLRGASEPADLAGDRSPSTRFFRVVMCAWDAYLLPSVAWRLMTVSSSSRENMPCFSPGLR